MIFSMNFSIEWMNEWFELFLRLWKWVKIRVFWGGVKMLENRWKSCFLGPPGFDEFHWIFYRLWFLWVSMNFFSFEWMIEWIFFVLFCFLIEEFFFEWCVCHVVVYEWSSVFECMKGMNLLYIYIDIYIYVWFFVTHPKMWQFVCKCV